jgi:hypothetical protein
VRPEVAGYVREAMAQAESNIYQVNTILKLRRMAKWPGYNSPS